MAPSNIDPTKLPNHWSASDRARVAAQLTIAKTEIEAIQNALAGGGGGAGADANPDQFTFTDVTAAFPSAQVISNEITLTGFNVLTIINVEGGTYSRNGAAFTSSEGFAQVGDTIRLQVRAADLGASPVQVTFTAGQTSSTWVVATGDVWTPGEQPEMMVSGFFQEDLGNGVISSWTSRGVDPITLTGSATKLPDGGGVLFQKGTSQNLALSAGSPDSTARHRWWLAIARADLANNQGINSDRWNIFAANRADGGLNHRHPKLAFSTSISTAATQVLIGSQAGQNGDADGDFANWNVIFGAQRGWTQIATMNGDKKDPVLMKAFKPRDDGAATWMGAGTTAPGSNTLGGDIAIDCLIIGQGEPHDAFIDKLVGWAHWRANRVDLLPADHPYKLNAPEPDGSEGVPARYIHDPAQWATFKAAAADTSHYGDAAPALSAAYSRVFFDDFLVDSVVDDVTGDETSMWFSPGWNTATGDAQIRTPSQTPDCYPQSAADGGTLKLRLQETAVGSNSWITGQIFTVNKAGKGRWWGGDRRIILKVRFLNYGDSPRPGFFPSLWGYGHGHLHWRTRNRIEPDWFEHEGGTVTDSRIAQTLHVHEPAIAYSTGEGAAEEILAVHDSASIAGKSTLTISDGFGEDFAAYDEAYHTYEWRIDDGFVINIIDGFEVARKIVCNELTMDTYHIITNAIRFFQGNPVSGEIYDMEIDTFEVWKKDSDLAVVPDGFTARPTLSGSLGGTITLTPNAANATDQLEIRWYRNDGEPIVGATGLTFDDSGALSTSLRAHVRNLSALSQPEAWTALLAA